MVRGVGIDLLLPWCIFSGEDIIVRGGLHLLNVGHLVSCQFNATLKRKVFNCLDSEICQQKVPTTHCERLSSIQPYRYRLFALCVYIYICIKAI